MIDVEEKKMPLISTERTAFKCPSCKTEMSFYASMILFCIKCKNPVINVIALADDSKYRLAYHFGTIDSMGKKVK